MLGAPEAIEDVTEIVGRDTFACIGNFDVDAV
jgi:hypothetical protein